MLLRAANLAGLGLAVSGEASIAVIGALCVSNGVLRAFFDPVATALVADLEPAERRVTAYSLQRVGINLGWAAGPAVAAIAAGTSYATLFYASVPVTLFAMLLVMRIDEPREPRSVREISARELLAFRGDGPFLRFLLSTVAFFILQVQLYQTLSIYAARTLGLSRAEVGTLYTLNGLLVVLLQLPTSRLINRIGTRAALVAGCLGYAAAYGAVGLARGHLTLLLCIAAVTLAEIVTAPAQTAAVTTLAPAGRTGAYAGLYGLAQVVGQSTGPLVGTAFLDGLPARSAWFALACFGAAAAAGYRMAPTEAGLPNKVLAREGPA
jgi:MFS family permease